MLIGVPYDEGWNVKVNGDVVETYIVGGGLTGIAIKDGFNNIEMNFVPKGFIIGAIASFVGAALFVCVLVIEKSKISKKALYKGN